MDDVGVFGRLRIVAFYALFVFPFRFLWEEKLGDGLRGDVDGEPVDASTGESRDAPHAWVERGGE